jgi:hypothetical protein
LWLAVRLAVSLDLILANRLGPVTAAVYTGCTNPESCINIGDLMTTPHMKMAIEELQEEQQRNAAEAKEIYWYRW